MKTNKILAFCTVLLFVSCRDNTPPREQIQDTDFLAANIDTSIKPGDDFFLYANNGWFKRNPIPASEGSNGLWQLIRDTINAQVREICERAGADTKAAQGSNKQKIGDLYFSGMDSSTINTAGVSAIRAELDQLGKLSDAASVANASALVHMSSGAPLFDLYVGQDDKISSKHAIFLHQGGLGLPDRSFYLETDERSRTIRTDYMMYLGTMLQIIGYDSLTATTTADKVMQLETSLAKASRSIEDTRDPHLNYNKMAFAALEKSVPAFDWKTFMAGLGIPNPDTVIVGQPEFLTALNRLLAETPKPVLSAYLQLHFLRGLAPYLDDTTYAAHFRFYNTTMRGITEMKPRWKRVVDQTNSSLGELIGQVYVDEYLPKGTKEKLQRIGEDIKTVYAERIRKLEWMSETTKGKALAKLNTMVMKVGYPDR